MIPGVRTAPHRSGRAAVIIVAILAAVIVAALAWFSDSLGMMVKLQMWDKEGPSWVVRDFLAAAKKRDKAAADRFLDIKTLQPVNKNGKWIGYRQPLPITGFANFSISDMTPKEFPAHPRVEYNTLGEGAAYVWVPAANGKDEKYRVERRPTGWIVTELGAARMSAK